MGRPLAEGESTDTQPPQPATYWSPWTYLSGCRQDDEVVHSGLMGAGGRREHLPREDVTDFETVSDGGDEKRLVDQHCTAPGNCS